MKKSHKLQKEARRSSGNSAIVKSTGNSAVINGSQGSNESLDSTGMVG